MPNDDMNSLLSDLAGNTKSTMNKVGKEFTQSVIDQLRTASGESRKMLLSIVADTEEANKMKLALNKKFNVQKLEQNLEAAKKSGQSTSAIEERLARARAEVEKRLIAGVASYRENTNRSSSAKELAQHKRQVSNKLQESIKALDEEFRYNLSAFDAEHRTETEESKRQRNAMINEHKKAQNQMQLDAIRASEEARKIEDEQRTTGLKATIRNTKAFLKDPSLTGALGIAFSFSASSTKDLKEAYETQKEASARAHQQTVDAKKAYQELQELGDKADQEALNRAEENLKAAMKEENKQVVATISANIKAKLSEGLDNQFQRAEEMLNTYQGHIDARLQGSDHSYSKMMDMISSNLSISPFVKTREVVDAMRNAVDQGIAYNVEQRAFLETISDKIANTFDAFDSNLTRLIRLQQSDSTLARLGMEAALTNFLNSSFEDSSYMSTLFDTVSGALIEAEATMTRDMSAQFEYTVQKWMGALSSLGMSEGAIQQITQGINYIATGDVTSLSSNTNLQTLFAMSASNAGLEYSELLLKGLDSSNTNKLLESMVNYLKEIAEGADNQVVRAAYGDIFNLSMSDWKAISNLTSGDISNISGNSLTYEGMQQQVNKNLSRMINSTTMGQMLNNVTENLTFSMAQDLVNNPATYAMYKMLNYMQERDIDINIPFVNAFGTGVDINASVGDLLKMGLGISEAMSMVSNIFAGLGSGLGLDVNSWGASDTTKRGTSNAFTTVNNSGTTSSSTYIANTSTQDLKNSTLSSAADDAKETSEITNKNVKGGYTTDDIYRVTIEGSEGNGFMRVKDTWFENFVYENNNLRTFDKRMNFDSHSLLVVDNNMKSVFGTSSIVENTVVKVKVKDATTLNVSMSNQDLTAITNAIKQSNERIASSNTSITNKLGSLKTLTKSELDSSLKQALKEMILSIFNESSSGVPVRTNSGVQLETMNSTPDNNVNTTPDVSFTGLNGNPWQWNR